MKKFTTYFTTVTFTLFLFSCGSSPETQLEGSWKHTGVEIYKEDGSELPADKADIKDQLTQSILDKNTTYTFTTEGENKSYTCTTLESEIKGEFQAIDLDGKIEIALFPEGGESASIVSINEITDTEFKTSFTLDGLKLDYTYTKQ